MKILNWIAGSRGNGRQVGLVILVTVICMVPFLNKAFTIDDPMYLWAAQQIHESPFDFYGFDVHWWETYRPMHFYNKNPPGVSYFLALAALIVGFREVGLHLAMMIPAVIATVGTYRIATRFTSRPVEATLCAMLTPVFLVSATTVMADVLVLAFYVWAIELWLGGAEGELDGRRFRFLLGSGLCIGLGFLTKYFAVSLIPLLGLYMWLRKRNFRTWPVAFFVPAGIMVAYEIFTKIQYGQALFLEATFFSTSSGIGAVYTPLETSVVGLSYLGGCYVVVLFFIPLLFRTSLMLVSTTGIAGLIIFLLSRDRLGAVPLVENDTRPWLMLAETLLFATTGLVIFYLVTRDVWKKRDPDSVFLGCWIVGTFVFSVFVNWSITARTLLPMAPAVGIVLMRAMENRIETPGWSPKMIIPLVAAAVLAFSVAWADAVWAGSVKTAAQRYARELREYPGQVLYFGHWGFQWYMDAYGGTIRDYEAHPLNAGDVLILPRTNSAYDPPDDTIVLEVYESQQPTFGWISTMNRPVGAGFYSALWGPLPYFIGPVPNDLYGLYLLGNNASPSWTMIPKTEWLGSPIDPHEHDSRSFHAHPAP